MGAGDIAACDSPGAEATARLLDKIPGTVYTTGDNVYDTGTDEQFMHCYHPTWGRHRVRTRPCPGNHDYGTPGAAGYYRYFGAAAGEPGKGYYSYALGAWRIIVLNSCLADEGGCDPGSPQERWLRSELEAHPDAPVLAYWHHPRFSSGPHGNHAWVQPFWQALYDHGAHVVLAGHDHTYERFASQTPWGDPDLDHGIRQFVVGCGGRSHYETGPPVHNSETYNQDTWGVLKLTLYPTRYEWEFVPESGRSFVDRGSSPCHPRRAPATALR